MSKPLSHAAATAVGFVTAAVKAKTIDEKKALLIARQGGIKPGTIIGQAFDAAIAAAKMEIRLSKADLDEIRNAPTRQEVRQEQRQAKGVVPETWGGSATAQTDLRKRAEHALYQCGKAASHGQFFLATAYCKLIRQAALQGLITLDMDHLSKVTRIPKLELQARLNAPLTEQELSAMQSDK